ITLVLMITAATTFTIERTSVTVMLKCSIRKYFRRIRIQPPVQQIKMMRGFMNPERTLILPLTMPAAKIGCTMINIQIPVEINTCDFPDRVVMQQFFDLCHIRTPAIIKSDDQFSIRKTLRIQDRLTFYLIRCHRLFGQDIRSG